jgi:peptidoglycan/LPS O-acetylase OafA/YrhL
MPATTTESSRPATVPGLPNKHFRGDIEGLRAVAVILVILDHLVAWPGGGFIGVDVFFVISGFLITGLLLRDYKKTQTIDFRKFYARRVRRIAPAASLVIVTTVVAGFFIVSIARAQGIAVDGIWSFFFAANWKFAAAGTDYFQAGAALSPLQHYWSLSVEEQFYLVWPWLTLVLLYVMRNRRRDGRPRSMRPLGIVFGVIVLLSFAWACFDSATNPTVAYFSTFSRTWELGIGAVLATLVSQFERIPAFLRPILAWIGVAGIFVGAFFITDAMPFPGPTAAIPVLSTALVIAAGTGGQRRFLLPLNNPVTRYVGRISYSLYLWHFPVVIYLGLLIGTGNALYVPLSLVIMAALAIMSFHFIEDPIRRSSWLEGKAHSRRINTKSNVTKIGVGGVLLATGAAVAIIALALGRVAPTEPAEALVPAATVAPTAAAGGADATAERTAAIQEALRTDAWPTLSPSVEAFGTNGRSVIATEWLVDGCLGADDAELQDPIANVQHCVYGNPTADAAHTAIIFGDSQAISYSPAVRQALGSEWQVRLYTMAACPASSAQVTKVGGAAYPECEAFRSFALGEIQALNPALVFIGEAIDNNRLASKADAERATGEWTAGATTTLTALSGVSGKVLYLGRPPVGSSLYTCQTPGSVPADCEYKTTDGYDNRVNMIKGVTETVGGSVSYVNTTSWFCSQKVCPAFISGTPVLADGDHLTNSQSLLLAPLIATAVAKATAE